MVNVHAYICNFHPVQAVISPFQGNKEQEGLLYFKDKYSTTCSEHHLGVFYHKRLITPPGDPLLYAAYGKKIDYTHVVLRTPLHVGFNCRECSKHHMGIVKRHITERIEPECEMESDKGYVISRLW